MYFFFFKQKTAYEMRISDWSSDVCSSDHRRGALGGACANDVRAGGSIGFAREQSARARCRGDGGAVCAGLGGIGVSSYKLPRIPERRRGARSSEARTCTVAAST